VGAVGSGVGRELGIGVGDGVGIDVGGNVARLREKLLMKRVVGKNA